jgi:hypothetical protein
MGIARLYQSFNARSVVEVPHLRKTSHQHINIQSPFGQHLSHPHNAVVVARQESAPSLIKIGRCNVRVVIAFGIKKSEDLLSRHGTPHGTF